MSQSRNRRLQRKFERECARRGHLELKTVSPGLARCAHCGDTVSLISKPLKEWQRGKR